MPPSSWASRYFPSALNFRLLRSGRNGSASFCLKTSPGGDSARVSALKFSTSDCHFANPTGSAGGRTSEQPAGRLDKLFIMSRSRFWEGLVPPKKSENQLPVLPWVSWKRSQISTYARGE